MGVSGYRSVGHLCEVRSPTGQRGYHCNDLSQDRVASLVKFVEYFPGDIVVSKSDFGIRVLTSPDRPVAATALLF
jgi:hypothetical protein